MPSTIATQITSSDRHLPAVVRRAPGDRLLGCLVLALAYFVAGEVALELATVQQNVSPLWPPTGIAIAALVRFGIGLWPGVILGSFLVNITTGIGVVAPATIAVGNTLEPVIAWSLLRWTRSSATLERPRDVLAYLCLAGLIAPVASATVGVTSLYVYGEFPLAAAPGVWETWWIGNAMGAMIVGPAIMLCPRPRWAVWRRRGLEIVLLALVMGGLASLAFAFDADTDLRPSFESYVLLPLLLWPAFRFGQAGVALALALIGFIALVDLLVGNLPDAEFALLIDAVLMLQCYLALAAITGLLMGALIDQRTRAEAQLQMAGHALDGAADMILWLDEQGAITYANRAATRRLGDESVLLHRPFSELSADFDAQGWSQLWQRLAAGDQSLELVLVAADDRLLPIDATMSRLPAPDGDYVCAILRDLSERRQLESELFQAQKQDALGRLAGGIAHDFNNLLASIRGNVELASTDGSLADKLRQRLDGVLAACDRAADLTSQILVFSRHQPTKAETLDLNAAVAEAAELARRTLPESLELEVVLHQRELPVHVDAIRLQQVLLNLLVNARDAMPEGGAIRLAITASDDRARITVHDRGAGIPDHLHDRIFDPFFTTKPAGQGTGLGLAIVHGAVVQMGGSIAVESTPEDGTSFHVDLPLALDREPVTAVSPRPDRLHGHAFGRGLRALLVEDNVEVRAITTQALTSMGFGVIAVEDGRAALARLETLSRPPDLLITDVVMPHLGGVDLARAIRERHPDLPAIFISGYSADHLTGDQPPNSHFLAKPFTIAELAETIGRLLPSRTGS